MTTLSQQQYLDHIAAESARFRAVLADCDPAARVPSCPDWDAGDLLWHLAGVQRFWAEAVGRRPDRPADHEDPERPGDHAEALARFDEWSALLSSRLAGVDPREEAWTWSEDHTVGFILRRQAHEALIHRLDAELAAGTVTGLDPQLAADGVREALEVMYGGNPPWGTFTGEDLHVRIDCTDTGDETWVQLGTFSGTRPESGTTYTDEPDLRVVPDPGVEPDAVVDGPAGALDAWLWHRADDSALSVAGDRGAHERFVAAVGPAID